MLDKAVQVTTDAFELRDVRCRSHPKGWSGTEVATGNTVVLVRRGSFRRRVRGVESVLDPATAYFTRPGDEQRFAHAGRHGDACTVIQVGDGLLAGVLGGDPTLPQATVLTAPEVDLEHRRLLAAARSSDVHAVTERTISLVAAVLEPAVRSRVTSGRPATISRQRCAVAAVREAIAEDQTIGLDTLAARIAISPHHLSRTFRAHTGETISRYRNRLRVRLALEQLGEGAHDLAALAATLGFADHAHLTRTIRAEVGAPPSHLREALTREPTRTARRPFTVRTAAEGASRDRRA